MKKRKYNNFTFYRFFVFFKRCGFDVNKFDLYFLMKRLDRDCDGFIGYNDFKAIFFNDFFVVYKKTQLDDKNKNSYSKLAKNNSTSISLNNSIKTTGTTSLSKSRNISKNKNISISSTKSTQKSKSKEKIIIKNNSQSFSKNSKFKSPKKEVEIQPNAENYLEKVKDNEVYDDKNLNLWNPNNINSVFNVKKTKENQSIEFQEKMNVSYPLSYNHSTRLGHIDYTPIISGLKDENNKNEKLAKFLCDSLNLDLEFESNKELLALKNDFFIRDVFFWFDYSHLGYFNKKDFIRVLTDLGIKYNTEVVNGIFKRFNVRKNDKIM